MHALQLLPGMYDGLSRRRIDCLLGSVVLVKGMLVHCLTV
jgi:hypothetical protein